MGTVASSFDGKIAEEDPYNIHYYRIDMTKSDILESPYFYLKQNDVIYVQPGKGKAGQADFNQNNTYKVSIVSAIISGVSVIASLLIATGIIKK